MNVIQTHAIQIRLAKTHQGHMSAPVILDSLETVHIVRTSMNVIQTHVIQTQLVKTALVHTVANV